MLKFVAAFYVSAIQLNDAEGGLYTVTYTNSDITSHYIRQKSKVYYFNFSADLEFKYGIFFKTCNVLKMMLCTTIWIMNLSSCILLICKIVMIFYLQYFFLLIPKALYLQCDHFSYKTLSLNFLIIKVIVIKLITYLKLANFKFMNAFWIYLYTF